jgi:hypothetical protein
LNSASTIIAACAIIAASAIVSGVIALFSASLSCFDLAIIYLMMSKA